MARDNTADADGFSVDLTNYRPRRVRRGTYRVANPWERNSTPLDHWFMATSGCAYGQIADRDECQRERWADHLTRCYPCHRAEAEIRIHAFAARRSDAA